MSFYISTASVTSAFKELSSLEIKQSSILHIFFILKACGYTRDSFKPVSNISEKGFAPAHAISSLFSHYEKHPSKYDFISPFSLNKWESQSPSEPLKKWVGGRIKNNVIGGATTWRKILDDDPEEGAMKFKYKYLEEIVNLTIKERKLNLFALAIWAHRFFAFPKKLTLVELSNFFKKEYNISDYENSQLFTTVKNDVFIAYEDHIHDTTIIRQKIGLPKDTDPSWFSTNAQVRKESDPTNLRDEYVMQLISERRDMEETILTLLNITKQVILSGPPGTSKSYYAMKIGVKNYPTDNITSIQFHPKYSYQDFIGGYFVSGSDVIYSDGVLIELVERANKSGEEFLLIIDEINRANVGQVFGETIQCLDRNHSTNILRNKKLIKFSIPDNLKIIATMNTADRSLGNIDFAIKRRFSTVYCPANPDILSELCKTEIDHSLADLLRILNNRLFLTLKNKELVIGHAFFLDSFVLEDEVYNWSSKNLELLFNFKILPLIEDYTRGNLSQLKEVLGEPLMHRLSGNKFTEAIESYILNES